MLGISVSLAIVALLLLLTSSKRVTSVQGYARQVLMRHFSDLKQDAGAAFQEVRRTAFALRQAERDHQVASAKYEEILRRKAETLDAVRGTQRSFSVSGPVYDGGVSTRHGMGDFDWMSDDEFFNTVVQGDDSK